MSSYSDHTDSELAGLLRESDETAFQIIYEHYWPKMYVVAGKRLNSTAEAEEVVQDIFLNLWRKRETFNLRVSFEHYLAVAVKFEVINRRAKRAKEAGLVRQLAGKGIKDDSTWRSFDLEELQKQLEYTINSLPPRCKLVFKMSREGDYTNKKIAQELDVSEKAVEKHITHALKILRIRFGHYLSIVLLLL